MSFVPTRLLAPILQAGIDKMNRELQTNPHADTGAQEIIAERALISLNRGRPEAKQLKTTPARRLYDILKGNSRCTGVCLADALLLAIDVKIEDTGLPTLPATELAALDRIEAACEHQGVELPLPVMREMADDLLEFARLVTHDGDPNHLPILALEAVFGWLLSGDVIQEEDAGELVAA